MPKLDLTKHRYTCAHHPEVRGYGRCRKCERVFCAECATFLEGVLTCERCIEALAEAEEAALVGVGDGAFASWLTIAIGGSGTTVLIYVMTILFR